MSRIARTESVGDSLCAVCHEQSEIFAIGPCDHSICYRCSTRMRVLCNQMYCPICRGDLPQVVFLTQKKKYDEVNRRDCIPNRKFRILFEDESVEEAYEALLEHRCRVCDKGPLFDTFSQLQAHMRRTHTLFACDLCLSHLKIFPFERKFYNRKDLASHRRTGDSDNRSYRGHPLCQFCDERYFDNDELLRHLRKDHFYCHFCDATNSNEYYNDYEDLKQHFKSKHFLCEEGSCASPHTRLTHAFSSEIDLKAHMASEHLGNKSKAQAKELRTIDISFQYAPRRRGRDAAGISADDYEDVNQTGRGQRRYRNREEPRHENTSAADNQPPHQEPSAPASPGVPALDDFPTLGGAPAVVRAPPVKKPATAEEDFPALSAKSAPAAAAAPAVTCASVIRGPSPRSQLGQMSSAVNGSPRQAASYSKAPTPAAASSDAVDTRPAVSKPSAVYVNSKNSWAGPRLPSNEDFPSLGGGKKTKSAVDGPNFVSLGVWSRKTKDDSGSGRPASASARQQSASVSKPTSLAALGKSLCDDGEFPSLGKVRPVQSAGWVEKKAEPQSSSKSTKSLSSNSSSNKNKNDSFYPVSSSPPDSYVVLNGSKDEKTEETRSKKKKKKQKEGKKSSDVTEKVSQSNGSEPVVLDAVSEKQTESVISEENKKDRPAGDATGSSKQPALAAQAKSDPQLVPSDETEQWQTVGKFKEDDFPALASKKSTSTAPPRSVPSQAAPAVAVVVNAREEKENKKQKTGGSNFKSFREEDFPVLQAVQKTAPPPGFQKPAKDKVRSPPGLNKPSSNQTRSPPGLSTPAAVNDSVSAIPMSVKLNMYTYVPPLDSGERNRELVAKVRKMLILKDDGFDQFRKLSGEFRSGQVNAQEYYRACKELFGQEKFLEVLPELVAMLPDILKQNELAVAHKQDKISATSPLTLTPCPTCHQLLRLEDTAAHLAVHANLTSDVAAASIQAAFPKELPVTGIIT